MTNTRETPSEHGTPGSEQVEYVAPRVVDYGSLTELTASALTGDQTDVPMNTHVPFILSNG